MKAEELATQLRIGNLLYYKGTTHIAKVELIHNKHFDCRDEYGGFTPNGDYEPIPLSEEVLLKSGFERISNFTSGLEIEILYYQRGKIIVYLLKDFFEVEIETSSGIFNLHQSFKKCLHQLQNIYYALTGEELEVSL